MGTLGTTWVLRRELDLRSRGTGCHDRGDYPGLAQPTCYLGCLSLVLLPFGIVAGDALRMAWLPLVVYSVYLGYTATRLCAGSLRDVHALRFAGVSASGVYWGKLLGSLAPLGAELLFSTPILFLLAAVGHGSLERAGLVVLILAGQVLWFGCWGMWLASSHEDPADAVQQGVRTASLLLFAVPMAAGYGLWLMREPSGMALGTLWLPFSLACSPALQAASMLTYPIFPDTLDILVAAGVLGVMVAAVVTWQTLCHLARRLQ